MNTHRPGKESTVTTPLSSAKIAQTPLAVKPILALGVLPEGITVSADGLTLCKRCPACGGTISVENTPKAVPWIAARNRICRPCEADLAASFTAWRGVK